MTTSPTYGPSGRQERERVCPDFSATGGALYSNHHVVSFSHVQVGQGFGSLMHPRNTNDPSEERQRPQAHPHHHHQPNTTHHTINKPCRTHKLSLAPNPHTVQLPPDTNHVPYPPPTHSHYRTIRQNTTVSGPHV